MDRDFSLNRTNGTRNPLTTVLFAPEDFKGHFSEAVDELDSLSETAAELVKIGKLSDAENMWRSQIVFLYGAFDFYMHELVKYGLAQIYTNAEGWEATEKYLNISISLRDIQNASSVLDDEAWFLKLMTDRYSSVTMMASSIITEHLNLVGVDWKKIARKVFYEQGSSENELSKFKNFLDKLFHRRNLLAHQNDRELSNAERNVISAEEVNQYRDTLISIVDAINEEVILKTDTDN